MIKKMYIQNNSFKKSSSRLEYAQYFVLHPSLKSTTYTATVDNNRLRKINKKEFENFVALPR